MGVVHKLRDDVVEFILAQKKARPEISVRKLSDVVLKEFQIVVSKSSISTVLKNASLNSPIGRHGSSGDEVADVSKKSAGTFKIPEHKKKQIFPSSKISTAPNFDKRIPALPKVIKIENKIDIKKEVKEIKSERFHKLAPAKIEQGKLPPAMSNLGREKRDLPEVVQSSFENAGMVFLKAAEWELAGGSILAKIFKDELGGRFDLDYEFLADVLLFPEMFDQKVSSGEYARRIGQLFSAGSKSISFDPQSFSMAMAAVNQIEDFGLKLAIEFEILSRGVSSVKITDRAGKNIFYNTRSKIVNLDNVQSGDVVSVNEATETFNTDIVRNVHSAVFHYFVDTPSPEDMSGFLLSVFGSHPENGFKEAVFCDCRGVDLVRSAYFPQKSRSFVLAVRDHKNIWSKGLNFGGGGEFKALSVLGRTFYYKEMSSERLIKTNSPLLRTVILSASPGLLEEPPIVLLTNVDGESEKLKQATLDFLYSWPGLTEENGPSLMVENVGQNELIADFLKNLQNQSAFAQCLPSLRRFLENWSRHRFFAPREPDFNDKAAVEPIYRLPGHIRNENERAVVLTLELAAGQASFDQLKGGVRRFNALMFRSLGGRRIIIRLASPAV